MAKVTNKEKALVALVESGSVAEAAEKSGLSKETLFRYLKDKEFLKEYREARRSIVETAVSEIQQASSEAVATLRKNLHCGNPAAENQAARLILDNSLRGIELIDVVERLEVLEDAIETQNQKG